MIYKTGHEIADTVAQFLPDGDYGIGYGILRGMDKSLRSHEHWFEVDKGFWGANHFDGNYRLSYKGTQPLYNPDFPTTGNPITLAPWQTRYGYCLILPPTDAVCEFFDIDGHDWLVDAMRSAGMTSVVRHKGSDKPIDWEHVAKVITFNSSLGIEAVRRGIPTISSEHSTLGSYTKYIMSLDGYDRDKLFSFIEAHHFKLGDLGGICRIIQNYPCQSMSAGMQGKPLQAMFSQTPSLNEPPQTSNSPISNTAI